MFVLSSRLSLVGENGRRKDVELGCIQAEKGA